MRGALNNTSWKVLASFFEPGKTCETFGAALFTETTRSSLLKAVAQILTTDESTVDVLASFVARHV